MEKLTVQNVHLVGWALARALDGAVVLEVEDDACCILLGTVASKGRERAIAYYGAALPCLAPARRACGNRKRDIALCRFSRPG